MVTEPDLLKLIAEELNVHAVRIPIGEDEDGRQIFFCLRHNLGFPDKKTYCFWLHGGEEKSTKLQPT